MNLPYQFNINRGPQLCNDFWYIVTNVNPDKIFAFYEDIVWIMEYLNFSFLVEMTIVLLEVNTENHLFITNGRTFPTFTHSNAKPLKCVCDQISDSHVFSCIGLANMVLTNTMTRHIISTAFCRIFACIA